MKTPLELLTEFENFLDLKSHLTDDTKTAIMGSARKILSADDLPPVPCGTRWVLVNLDPKTVDVIFNK